MEDSARPRLRFIISRSPEMPSELVELKLRLSTLSLGDDAARGHARTHFFHPQHPNLLCSEPATAS